VIFTAPTCQFNITISSWLHRVDATSFAHRLTRFAQGTGIAPIEKARAREL
jgi:hypothetical protein